MKKLKEIIKELNDLKIKQTQINWHLDILNKKPELIKYINNVEDDYVNAYSGFGYSAATTVLNLGKIGYLGIRHITSLLFEGVTYKSVDFALEFVEMEDITDHTKIFIEKPES